MICSLTLNILTAAALLTATAENDTIIKVVNLGEVSVTATHHKIEDRGGKIVYNAYLEKVRTDVSTADLMRKVPMLSVDMSGNVNIRGDSNVKILVNGHSLGMLAANQILEQISPADVLKVEVMTTPGAKYEAQGTGGVVNIITSKKMYFKSSGYLNAGLGTKGSHLMGNFNYAIDRLWTLQNSFYSLIGYSATSSSNNFSGNSDGRNLSQLYSYQSGATRNGENSALNLNLQYMYQGTTYNETIESGIEQKKRSGYHYVSASAEYSWMISEKIKMDAQTRWYYLPTSSAINRSELSDYKSGNHILGQMTQTDWNIKLTQQLEIETGVNNNYSHFNVQYQNRLIKYIDNIGVYSEVKYSVTPMLSMTGGLRYEYYHIDTKMNRKNTYHDLFYNIGLDYKLSAISTLSLMYSRRTDRPTYAALLNDGSYQGGGVIQQGNEAIQPSYSYLLEGGASLYVGDCFFKFSPYYRRTDRAISLLMQMDDNMMWQSSTNIESSYACGAEFWATLSLLQGKLNFNGGLDFMHKKLQNSGISNSGWQLQYSMNVTYRLSPTLYVNCYGSWQNKKVYLQGREDSYLYSNLSVQKSWHNDQYRVAVSLDNPFGNGVNVRRDYHIDNADYFSETRYRNTGVRVFFIYKFGKHDMENNMKIKQNILNNY